MKLAACMIVRDEAYYIDMAIKSVLPFVDGMYIIDTGSEDGTQDVIRSFNSDKIILKEEPMPFARPDFAKGDHTNTHPYWWYDATKDGCSWEAEMRNKAVVGCEKAFEPDWLIMYDGDEVFTPFFFESLSNFDLANIVAIKHATDAFITKNRLAYNAKYHYRGHDYFDPHVRSWNPKHNIRWIKKDQHVGHVLQRADFGTKTPICQWMPGVVHLHLRWMFGPKSESHYGLKREPGVKYDPRNTAKFKEWYASSREVNFDWNQLPYVLDKWEEWGLW